MKSNKKIWLKFLALTIFGQLSLLSFLGIVRFSVEFQKTNTFFTLFWLFIIWLLLTTLMYKSAIFYFKQNFDEKKIKDNFIIIVFSNTFLSFLIFFAWLIQGLGILFTTADISITYIFSLLYIISPALISTKMLHEAFMPPEPVNQAYSERPSKVPEALLERFPTAKAILEYRPDASGALKSIEGEKDIEQFLQKITERPQSDPMELIAEIKKEKQKFDNEETNHFYEKLGPLGEVAKSEYEKMYELLGEKFDPEHAYAVLNKKYGTNFHSEERVNEVLSTHERYGYHIDILKSEYNGREVFKIRETGEVYDYMVSAINACFAMSENKKRRK